MTRTITNYPLYDAVVIGGTETAFMAALHADRQGMKVLLACEGGNYGGMTGWGMNHPDFYPDKSPSAIGPAPKEFYSRVAHNEWAPFSFKAHYRSNGDGKPNWYRRAFDEMMAESRVTVIKNAPIRSLTKSGTTIQSAVLGSRSYYGQVFIDGTPCGDVARMALTSKQVGRESAALYGESGAGVLASTAWPGSASVDPYVIAGNSGSGLLYGIEPGANGNGTITESVGDGDGRVMAFSYRLFLTSVVGEKAAFPAPNMATYSAAKYELLARAMADKPLYYGDSSAGLDRIFTFYNLFQGSGATMGPTYYSYVDLNSTGPLSIDYPDSVECLEYVTATPERRAVIEENAKQWILGLFHWILNSGDSRIPSAIVTALGNYGLSNKEIGGTSGFSPQFYAREGTRAVGDFVLTKTNAVLQNGYTDGIAYGFYWFDSKPVRRVVASGLARYEGIQTATPANSEFCYPIPYRVLLPKATECTNLLVPNAPSVTHLAWRSVRAIPTLMQLGAAAGVAAAIAVRDAVTVQNVDVTRLKRIVDLQEVWDGIVLNTDGTYAQGTVTVTGTTTTASNRFGFLGSTFRKIAATTNAQIKFAPNLYRSGAYRVMVMYPPADTVANGDEGRATNAAVTISHASGTTSFTLNQNYPLNAAGGGVWEDLGVYTFRAGVPSADYVQFDNTSGDGILAVSAVKWVPLDSLG